MANALSDYFGAYDAGYNRMQGMADQLTTRKAGNALASGDYGAAAAAFYKGGMVDQGLGVQRIDQQNQDRAYDRGRQEKADARQGRLDEQAATKAKIDELERTLGILAKVPEGQRSAALKSRAQVLAAVGLPAEQLTSLGEQDLTDQALASFGAGLAAEKEQFTLSPGSKRYEASGKLIAEAPFAPEYKSVGPGEKLFQFGGEQSAQPGVDDLFGALIMQESGGKPGVVGPKTEYGQAEGLTQMLPQTAQGMAQKLGLPWRPDLMRGTTPEAARYQETLGRAYFEEGLRKYGGDPVKALMYYHGGPDERLWGPKTQQYAQDVLGRVGSYQTASNGAVAPPGGRLVAEGGAKQKDAPSGYQWTSDGTLSAIPGGPGDPATKANQRPVTEGQVNNASLAYAAFQGNNRLNELAKQGIYKPQSPLEDIAKPGENGLVMFAARTPQDRAWLQASLEFLAPILRKDTGAAVTFQELVTYGKMYLPDYRDPPQVLWQKAQARDGALRRLYGSGRRAYDEEYGAPGRWQVLTDPRAKPQKKGAKPQTGKAASGKVVQVEVIG